MTSLSDDADEAPWGYVAPASRFHLEQSWWICSELVRRHPDHIVYEMHPAGGSADVLVVRPARKLRDGDGMVQINRGGTIRVEIHRDNNNPDWIDVGHSAVSIAERNPHALVKELESVARMGDVTTAPSSTPRSLVFRFASTVLTSLLNDRHSWDWRQSYLDSSGLLFDVPPRFIDRFPSASEEARRVEFEPWDWRIRQAHFWALLRDDEPIAMVSTEGRLHFRGRVHELYPQYVARRRNIHALASDMLLSHLG